VHRHVKTPEGKPLVEGKNVTGFTNGEESSHSSRIREAAKRERVMLKSHCGRRPATSNQRVREDRPDHQKILQRMTEGHPISRLDDLLPWNWPKMGVKH
jgi:hypothetical protein